MRKRFQALTILSACLSGLGVWASPARAGLVYSQPSTLDNYGYYYANTSSYVDSNYDYFLTRDNFSLASATSLTQITWQGMYLGYNSSTGNYSNGSANSSSWYVDILDANFNLVTYQVIQASNVSETYAGLTTFNNSSGNNATVEYYNDSAQLNTPILLNPNQTYYIGILSENLSPSSSDFWAWMSGSGGDGVAYQYDSYNGYDYQIGNDQAFGLIGTPSAVPEPASLAMLGLGVIGVLSYSRIRRRASTQPV